MNSDVFILTLREFASQRRSLLILLLAFVPVGLALIFQVGDREDSYDFTVGFLLDNVVITRILPLACLILGTAALGSEIEDGTIVYLLAKPVPRRAIVLAKFAAATVLSAAFIVPATVLAGALAISGDPGEGIVLGFGVAALVGAVTYTALFIALSVMTSRALIAGLVYVFVWEGLVSDLFQATAYLSVRHYCLGIADMISSVDSEFLSAELDGPVALALPAILTLGSLYLTTHRLETLELGESE